MSRPGRTVSDPADLAFIDGFPCPRSPCPGTLTADSHEDTPAIVCSACERVYYVLRE